MNSLVKDSSPPKRESFSKHGDEIYSNDYWQKKVGSMMEEKKNLLKLTEKSHHDMRNLETQNKDLHTVIKQKEIEID